MPHLPNKAMEMKIETNNLKAVNIDASTNAVQQRCTGARAGRRKASERGPTHGRLEWKPDGWLFWQTKEAQSPQPGEDRCRLPLEYFFPLLVRPCSDNQTGASTCLTRPKWRGAGKAASTNKY